MPIVGKKHFSYSKKGRKAAATYAKKKGKKVTVIMTMISILHRLNRRIDQILKFRRRRTRDLLKLRLLKREK